MKPTFSSIEPLEARIAPAFLPVFPLSSLDGINGFTLSGAAAGDFSGGSVSGAGDVNGDGFGDLIISAIGAHPNGSYAGASYVVFGKSSGFGSNLTLSTLNGSNGFKLTGGATGDYFGASVSGAGDVNGDGFDDLIIGASSADPNGSNSGASYVVFGRASGFDANLDVSALNGVNGFKLSGVAADDFSGTSVSSAGDVNGDGFDDVIIGASAADPNGLASAGTSYVVFGKATAFAANLNLSALDGKNGFKLSGVAAFDVLGLSVSAAGDVNGDGLADLIVGARRASPNGLQSGASYVVFGKTSGFSANLNLSTLNGVNGFKVSGVAAGDYSGTSVSSAGDVNGDGFDDLIIGAPKVNLNGAHSGASYVVLGKATGFGANLNLSGLNGTNGFKLTGAIGDYSGESVSGAGDVNGDGFDDFIIGASRAEKSYVIFGKTSGFAANLNLSALDGTSGFKLTGVAMFDSAGASVSAAGDVNGDGFDDVFVSAPSADPNGDSSGASYVVFGRGVEINVGDAVVIEGDAGTSALRFTVSLSEAAGLTPVSVKLVTADGTAVVGSDFASLGAATVVTFAPGETSKTVTVNVTGDALFEGDETFSVVLSDAVGGVIRDGTGVGTIRNDDAAPTVSIAGGSLVEGDSGTSALAFTVSLSAASGVSATVSFASADDTALAGSDYAALAPGTLTFAPGETTKTITVELLGDTRVEDHETFSVVLTNPVNAGVALSTATGTILNDETAIGMNDVSGLEGDTGTATLVFAITLEKASALPVTVKYATADGTASAGADFTAPAAGSQITFAPGETMKTITIEVLGDTSVEAHENFSVVLSAPTNARLANDTATGTILNDDALVRIDDVTVLEGHLVARTLTFTVSLTAASALPVSVDFASADDSATAGSDYTALSGTLTFAPGETTKTITVAVLGDTVVEPGIEIFSVLVSGGVNVVIDKATGIGTILDDDVLLTGKRTATFTDVDGELATIKVSKGALKVEDFTLVPSGLGSQLALVDFSGDSEFAGANLSVKSKRVAKVGDLIVDVGAIEASGIDLGKVSIEGDLGQLDAGSGEDTRPALKSLKAHSMGQRGLETQLPGGSMQSEIAGALEKLELSDGMHGAELHVSGEIGLIAIKGDVSGSTLRSDTTMGAVKVLGNWTASNLAAGVAAGDDGYFGTDDDALIAGASLVIARVASILIKGVASGTSDDATDHFAFVAAQIDAFKADGTKMTLSRGPSNDLAGLLVGANDDLRVREVG